MGKSRRTETARTLASMRREGIAPRYSDTHDANGHRRREPRPAPRRQSSGRAAVLAAIREAY